MVGDVVGTRKKKRPVQSKHWACWLCSMKNGVDVDACASCQRSKVPEWLRLVTGENVEVGNFVKVRMHRKDYYGLVTQIDYLERVVEVFGKQESRQSRTEEKKDDQDNLRLELQAGDPQQLLLSEEELLKGALSLVWNKNETDESKANLALSLCDWFLCGKCGSLSHLSHGKSVLDSEQVRADKAGRLRGLEMKVKELENKSRYLTRKWRESKRGYDELSAVNQELEEVQGHVTELQKQLAPVQFWCCACGWEWPKERPFEAPLL